MHAQEQPLPFDKLIRELAAGSISCMVASAITHPLDQVKTRLQVSHRSLAAMGYPKSLTSTTHRIWREEGLRGLIVPGLTAALIREIFYSSLRFGLYAPVKQALHGGSSDSSSIMTKLTAGMMTGALGSAIANPTDLLKVKLIVDAGRKDPLTGRLMTGLRAGQMPMYRHTGEVFVQIWREKGIRGLYEGTSATVVRSATLTGAQLASYDHSKQWLKSQGHLEEGPTLHVLCSIISSFCAATFSAPADLLKTRLMGDPQPHPFSPLSSSSLRTTSSLVHVPVRQFSSQTRVYNGLWDCLVQTVRHEGVLALYRGWLPAYLRLTPHFILSMPLYEQCRLWFGLGAM